MKKRILAILLALVMSSLLMVACGNNEAPNQEVSEEIEETTDEPEEEEQEEELEEDLEEDEERETPTRGRWDNGVYTNEYLGLRFAPPSEWRAATDEEIAATMGLGMEVMDAFTDVDVSDEMWDQMDSTFHEMMASNIFTNASVQIVFENLGFAGFLMSESNFIDMMEEELSAMEGIGFVRVPGTTEIGEYDWYSFGTVIEMNIPEVGEITVYGRQFVNIHRGFIRLIQISYSDHSESLEEILDMFIGLDDPIPEHTPLEEGEHAEELVGTWEWDVDSSYTYTFNADGTGSRGFTFMSEDFEWMTMGDDHLVIEMGLVGVESWTFTISDGVLTIDSRQIAGMTYSYIRR
jgi:hypothetical protein